MSTDFMETLASDHADLRRIFSAYTGVPFHDPERKQLADRAAATLMRDMRIENVVLYPLARSVPDTGPLVDQGLAEAAEIEALLLELHRSDQDTTGFDRLVAQLVERATGHANRQEAQLFPVVRNTLTHAQLAEADERAEMVRRRLPAEPRAGAQTALPPDDLPPAERTVGQRVKDLLSPAGRGQQPAYSADSITHGEDAMRSTHAANIQPISADPDIIELLLGQHVRIEGLFARVKATAGGARQTAFDELRGLLAVHETGEEMVLRPVSKKAAGLQVAEARNREEQEANKVLAELEHLDVSGPEFEARFAHFEQSVLAHAQHEEKEEFPRVRAQCSAAELAALGEHLLRAEETAPTHPHVSASGSPAAHKVVGPFAALIDRVRDRLSS